MNLCVCDVCTRLFVSPGKLCLCSHSRARPQLLCNNQCWEVIVFFSSPLPFKNSVHSTGDNFLKHFIIFVNCSGNDGSIQIDPKSVIFCWLASMSEDKMGLLN